jgi:hypothetical protein
LVADKSSGRLGEQTLAVGDIDGDDRPEVMVAGGRAGKEPSSGLVWIIGTDSEGNADPGRRFESIANRPGYGRILAIGPGYGGALTLAVGRTDRANSNPMLELWQAMSPGSWRESKGPEGFSLAGLNDIALPGDLTGDGVNDLVLAFADERQVGLRIFPATNNDFGHVTGRTIAWPAAEFGARPQVWNAGDVDHDGMADLLVSFQGLGDRHSGRVALLLGNSFSAPPTFAAEWHGSGADSFGKAVLVTDLTGDKTPELVIAAPAAEGGRGRVVVFRARRGGWESDPWVELAGEKTGDAFGSALAVGRFHGKDRKPSLVVGAPKAYAGFTNAGVAYCLRGASLRTGPVGMIAALKLQGGHWNAELGSELVCPGDLDGDGHDDLVLGLPTMGHIANRAGRIELLFGARGWPESGAWTLTYPREPFVQVAPRQRNELPIRPASSGGIAPAVWVVSGLGLVFVIGGLWWWHGWVERHARERERLRIARDLHDELGAQLSQLSAGRDDATPEIAAAAHEVTVGLERTIWALHPERRSLLDLSCGLTDLAENILSGSPCRGRFEFPEAFPDLLLPAEVVEAAYRSAQEALNNVRKHSRATEVTIGLHCPDLRWEIFVQDNGIGLPVTDAPAAGIGLLGMTARMKEVGGECRFRGGKSGGTTVVLVLPRIY